MFSRKKKSRRAFKQTLSLFISVSVMLSLFQPMNALASLGAPPTGPVFSASAGEMRLDTGDTGYTLGESDIKLEEDFNDGTAEGWTLYAGVRRGEWSVTDDAYSVFDSSGDKALVDLDDENFILEGDIHLHEGWQNSGFVFRVSDPGNGADKMNGYFVGIGNPGVLEIGRMDSGGNNGSGSWTEIAKLSVAVNVGSVNRLKITGIGDKYDIELNDALVHTFSDNTYLRGIVGLRAWNDNGRVSYDNLRYTGLTLLPEIPEEPTEPGDPQEPSATFTDNFDDGNADGWTTYGGTFTVTDGKYAAKNGSGTKAVASATSFSNFIYEADVSLGNGTNDQNAGLIFRVQDPTVGADNLKGYYAGIGIHGRVQVGRFNNNWTELASIPYKISPNTVYRMKVVADGRNIDVYMNEELIVSVVDRTYTTGAIGVRNFLIDATYDNISVTDTGPSDLPSFDWSWVQGAVFVPTNAVNQIQQWHQYDHDINDREMYYAHLYGINLVRVYIHNLLWEYDRDNLLANMEDFLQIADKYGMKVEVVFFDDCWNDYPEFRPNGDYPAPVFGKHNSQWVEGPGDAYKAKYNDADGVVKQKLEDYVKGVVSHFKDDERIAFWNVYNEPSNGESGLMNQVTKQIMNDSRIWIREVNPIHPMSSTGWQFSGGPFSDFITYHPYESNYPIPAEFGDRKEVLADEVMNRLTQSVPGVVSGFGDKGLGFVMWEFGIGRDNTRFYWGTDVNPAKEEMEVPFHGIVYPDGHPWDVDDVKAMIGEESFNKLPVYNVSYYFDDNFAQLAKKSIAPLIDFDLGDERSTGSPDASVGIDKDHFSVRWIGTVQPAETGEYTIYADSDNIARVWIGDRQVIDKTSGTREEVSGKISLTGNDKYAVKVEYVHAAGDASLHLSWSGPELSKQAMRPVYAGKTVESISFDEAAITLKTGESRLLIPQFTPADASNQNVSWSSDKPGIASVNPGGVVKGVAKGTAIITATTIDGGKTASVEVKVQAGTTFTNPIVQVSGGGGSADPSIVFKDGYYYYVKSMRDNSIVVAKARRLQDIGSAPRVTVYTPPSGTMYSKELWAPELQYIDGKWYIYFAADNGDNANHRMYVLEGNSQDPQGTYTFKGKITDSTDRWAIDGAVLQTDDGELYFVWSGWEGNVNESQNIYIARMSNPWTISGPRVMISTPTEAWEKIGGTPTINEGPEILKKNGKIFIIYSASGSWSDDYTLGMLTNTDGKVLDPASWAKSGPVFSKVPTAYGPGHNTFTTSPDGTEDWIVYHAVKNAGGGWANRSVRAQKFTWNADGTPNFGTPVPYGAAVEEPSGTPAVERYQYEAEDARLGGKAAIVNEGNALGGKVAGRLDTASDYVEFNVDVDHGGDYTLIVMADNGTSGSAAAEQSVSVNGGAAQGIVHPSFGWGNYNPSSIDVHLQEGSNTIRIAGKNNFAQVDYIVLDRIEADTGQKPLEELLLDESAVSVRAGASVTVEVSARPIAGTDKTLAATSSDGQVAEVAWSGKDTATGRVFYTITGVKPGTANIQFTSSTDGGLSVNLQVTVLGEPGEPELSGFTVDHFDSVQLGSAWSVVKENKANWSLAKNPGALTISTTNTDVYQDNNSQDNVFLRNVSKNSDFEIIAKLSMPITANHEQAGLFVWEDADNFVKLGHVWSNGPIIETAYELNRTYRKPGNYAAHPGGDTMTLKIRKMGNVYTTFYWDGYQWLQASDPVTVDLGDVKVGLYANSIVSGNSKNALFDYFAVREITGGVDIAPKTATLQVGESVQLANTGASGANVKWSSSNPSVAEVNTTGLVQANAPGRAVITATDTSGSYRSQAVITVEDAKPVPEILYEEDFSQDDTSDWVTYGGNWTISSDRALTVNSGAGFKALLKGKQFTDYIYEADVTLVSGTEAGLIFRTTNAAVGADAQDSYYVGINAAGKSAVLGEMKNGVWREIASRPVPIQLNQAYRIKVVVDQSHIQVYINDNPLNLAPYPKFDLVDGAHPGTGAIGFRTWNAEAKFDNVKVSSYAEEFPDQTYYNPTLLPDIADPYVLLHEGTYYLYGTNTAPNMPQGFKVYTSTDLVNWQEQENYALSSEDSWGNNRFWAPEVIEKNGTFYMYYAVEERLAIATSDSPLGPFVQDIQQPLHLNTPEIDAHIFTDDDGKSYMYFVRFNNNNHILVAEMNEDMKSIKEDTIQFVFAPTQNWELSPKAPAAKINEGPFVIKHNGTYYMTYSGNHFESPDYGVGYATAPTPTGPWTKYEYNPIMKSNTLVPGAGHHSLIYSPDGTELFMVYHTHYGVGQTNPRKLAIDRVQFVPQGNGLPDAMEVWGPTMTPQPIPSNKNVEPEPVAVERIAVSGSGGVNAITGKGGTLQLLAEVHPNHATDKRVSWSITSGASYAELSSAGVLTAKANGTVKVRATSVSTPDVFGETTITISGQQGSTGGGGNPSGGTNSPTPASSGAGAKPSDASGQVNGNKLQLAEGIQDANGTVIYNVPKELFERAASQAVNGVVTIVAASGSADQTVISMLTELLEGAISQGIKQVNYDLGYATVMLDLTALPAELGGRGELTLKVSRIGEQPNLAGVIGVSGKASVYELTLEQDGSILSDLDKRGLRIGLDYELEAGQLPENIVAFHIDNKGQSQLIVNGAYYSGTGRVELSASRLGTYAVVYRNVPFSDLGQVSWAGQGIRALASRGIVQGTGDGKFLPSVKVTRAEFVSMLMRAFELNDPSASSNFSDIQAGAWYYEAVASAQKLGIVNGKSDGSFGIGDAISRQEMAAMAYRAASQAGISLSTAPAETAFHDQKEISAYALDAVHAMKSSGIISGKSGNLFAPQDHATRAEAATVIYNMFKLVP